MRRLVVLTLLTGTVGLGGCFPLLVAGGAGAAMVANDRRTSGTYLDDQTIELKASSQINKKLPSSHVNITSYNRAVLMTGEMPSEAAREEAKLIVRALPNVRKVDDFTVIAPVTGITDRNNDIWIATKVRARMLDGKGFPAGQVRIVTERGVVYLQGMLTQAEGEAAARVASETTGVQKVVTLFEYINAIQ